jgi:hypothetical protein
VPAKNFGEPEVAAFTGKKNILLAEKKLLSGKKKIAVGEKNSINTGEEIEGARRQE